MGERRKRNMQKGAYLNEEKEVQAQEALNSDGSGGIVQTDLHS